MWSKSMRRLRLLPFKTVVESDWDIYFYIGSTNHECLQQAIKCKGSPYISPIAVHV